APPTAPATRKERPPPRSSPPRAPGVAQDLARGVPSVRARDAAAGMRPGAAQVEPADRRSIVGPAPDRPEEQQLVGRHVTVERVAAGEAEEPLEIKRRQ